MYCTVIQFLLIVNFFVLWFIDILGTDMPTLVH